MNRSTMLLATAAAAAASHCRAQSFTADSTIHVTLDASEAPGGNGNGVIEPGESALIRMNISFTNQNTIGHFSPPIGTFGSGTIRAFGWAWLDHDGSGGTTGSWDVDPNHGNGPQGIWDISGHWGTVAAGDLIDIQLGQFPPDLAFSYQNPISPIWQGVWTPDSYDARTVTWNVASNPGAGAFVAAVILKLSNVLAGGVFVDSQHLSLGSVQITVAPAPGSALTLLAIGFLATGRRRRIRFGCSRPRG